MLRAFLFCVLALTLATTAAAQRKKPPLPPGGDPGGVAIALLGTGIDYTVREVARRLARDGEGELIGWDLADKDNRPFRPSSNATAPVEWGGDGTALVKAFGTPGRRVVPVKIDPADPPSLARAIAFVAQTPARVVVVPMWSRRQSDWEPFRQAALHFKDLLFVLAAGEEGKDTDRRAHLAGRLRPGQRPRRGAAAPNAATRTADVLVTLPPEPAAETGSAAARGTRRRPRRRCPGRVLAAHSSRPTKAKA